VLDSSNSLSCNIENDFLFGDTGEEIETPLGESLGGERNLSDFGDESAMASCCPDEECGATGEAAVGLLGSL